MFDEHATPATYIERWEQALRVLETMDEHTRTKHFDMGDWGRKTECGTVACLAGHCSLDPWFQQRGFNHEFVERVDHKTKEKFLALDFSQLDADDFFGDVGTDRVFMRVYATYEDTLQNVRDHIRYLKEGGEAVEPSEYEDYYDEGNDDE